MLQQNYSNSTRNNTYSGTSKKTMYIHVDYLGKHRYLIRFYFDCKMQYFICINQLIVLATLLIVSSQI